MNSPAAGAAPKDGLPSVLRFATELVAWIATPWWLAGTSWLLSAASLLVLIGLPTVFATPGDRNGKGAGAVPVPGYVTIGMVLLQLLAAVVSAWALWPAWAAVCVSALAGAALVTEQPRWRWLLRRGCPPAAGGPAGNGFGVDVESP